MSFHIHYQKEMQVQINHFKEPKLETFVMLMQTERYLWMVQQEISASLVGFTDEFCYDIDDIITNQQNKQYKLPKLFRLKQKFN